MKHEAERHSDISSTDRHGIEDSDYPDQLLEVYKIYVTTADRVSERRANANSFFLSILTVLISIMGAIGVFSGRIDLLHGQWIVIVSLVGLLLCYSWYQILQSYRQLNDGKFKVIHQIEEKLTCRPFCDEWKVLSHGSNKKIYKPITHIEKLIPLLFSTLFVLIIIITAIILVVNP